MKRNFKPIVVGVALVAALVLTITRRESNRINLAAGEASSAAPGPQADRNKAYDLTSLHVFKTTLMRVNDAYVDPTRVDPKQMLLASLDYVQKSVAEVMVEPHPEQNRVVVRVDTAQKEFPIGDVDSPWMLSVKMKDIFRFIAQNLQPGTELKEVEYNATNGMLSTLDPHSVLLEPVAYNEMKLTTRGQFGGLGIVIGIRKNALTVIRPMPGTPAWNAGIRAGDKIVRIEKEATDNMMLNDAVSRLRGEPDSKVEVWVQHLDQPAKRHVLTRAVISVNSVQAHLLKGGVGYIKLSQFSGTTVEEMRKELEQMKAQGPLKGIVLDLRDDPGGLLDQAIKVTDEFVESGTIVTTVGYANKQRDEKRAAPGNQPHVPMAVLVNGGSASASEIVAGALKNLDRAVILGSRTFGKGSVQVLYDNDDGSALKLTIAQYLTPGDISIQSVGIVPDIAVEPTMLTRDRVSIFRPSHALREQDLDAHLTSRNTRSTDKPSETLRYLSEQAMKKAEKSLLRDDDKDGDEPPVEDDDAALDAEDDSKFTEDYEITLARELVSQAKGWRRREVLASAKPFFDKKATEEQQKIAENMKKLGIDWSEGTKQSVGVGRLETQVTTDKQANQVKAGEVVKITLAVTNRATQPAWQVRAITKSDDPLMQDREFVFGKLMPGETRTWTVPVKVDRAALPRLDIVKFEVYDDGGAKVGNDKLALRIDGMQRPRFAYDYQLIDDIKGNGDGLVQRGESVRLHATVKNVGDGRSYETMATLSNKSGDGVTVNKGRFAVNNLQPGTQKSVDFTFDVASDFGADTVTVQMDVYDQVLHEFVTDKISFPVAEATQTVAASGAVTVTGENTELRAGAAAQAQVVGHAKKGATFKITGRSSGFYRVEVEPGRPAFLAMNMASEPKSSASGVTSTSTMFTPSLQVMPPRLAIQDAPLSVEAPKFRLRGTANDEKQVTDLYVFVTNRTAKIDHRKVFYHSNRKGGDPKALKFEADIPVWPGANQVTVVARKANQVQSQQTLIIQGPQTSQQPAAAAHAVRDPLQAPQ